MSYEQERRLIDDAVANVERIVSNEERKSRIFSNVIGAIWLILAAVNQYMVDDDVAQCRFLLMAILCVLVCKR